MLMFGWDFGVDAWSRFWKWIVIKICVRNCDMNSTLGSDVPLAMFLLFICLLYIYIKDVWCLLEPITQRLLFYKWPRTTIWTETEKGKDPPSWPMIGRRWKFDENNSFLATTCWHTQIFLDLVSATFSFFSNQTPYKWQKPHFHFSSCKKSKLLNPGHWRGMKSD